MPNLSPHWKNEIPDVRSRATLVRASPLDRQRSAALNAHETARAISGAVAYVATRYGTDTMQRACVDIVRCHASWSTSFGTLPTDVTGRTPEVIEVISALCRGVLSLSGAENMRAALSFWACDSMDGRDLMSA